MSFVTRADQAKALKMVGTGAARRDNMLLSLARQTSWTTKQRALIEKLWNERIAHKEATMTKAIAGTVAALAVVILGGCATTYEKRFIDHEGRQVVIEETHDADWWNSIGTPDWMDVRWERITRDGNVVTERRCRHEGPWSLDCRPEK